MAVSETLRKIRDLHKISTERRALEKREEALKVWFRHEAGAIDATFADPVKGLEVVVTSQERTTVDLAALREQHPKIAKALEKKTQSQVVTCRAMTEEAA